MSSIDDFSSSVSNFTLLLFVPSLSVTARRLQDRGWSGWWQLLYLTIVGILVIVVLNILPLHGTCMPAPLLYPWTAQFLEHLEHRYPTLTPTRSVLELSGVGETISSSLEPFLQLLR